MFDAMITVLLASAQAAAPAQAGAAQRTAATANPDEVVCRQPVPVLGSRVAQRRVCHTRAEWQAIESDRAQLRRDLQNSSRDPHTN